MEGTRADFAKVISEQYKDYCKLKGIEMSDYGLTAYLINRTIITDLTIKRFLVIDKYPLALSENMGIKKLAIWQIEDEVNVCQTTIRTILDRFQSFFMVKRRVKCKS